MLVEQIWTANSGRNFNYLIACAETGEALAVDPLDYEKCLAAAKAKGWNITQILNTHHHRDHTGGNDQVIAATGAKLLAHANAKDQIEGIDRGLKAGDVIKVGRSVELECLDTPGHTMSHICVLSRGDDAGAVLRRHAVQRRRRQLPQRRPSERAVQHLRRPAGEAGGQHAGLSRARLHLQQSAVHLGPRAGQRPGQDAAARDGAAGHQQGDDHDAGAGKGDQHLLPAVAARRWSGGCARPFPDLPEQPDQKTVFLKLRELRNKW